LQEKSNAVPEIQHLCNNQLEMLERKKFSSNDFKISIKHQSIISVLIMHLHLNFDSKLIYPPIQEQAILYREVNNWKN
jgi:hypothetical protein